MRADVTLTPFCGPGTQIKVGGADITKAVRSARLDMTAGTISTLAVEIDVFEGAVVGEVELVIPPATVAALEAMGWKPPTETKES